MRISDIFVRKLIYSGRMTGIGSDAKMKSVNIFIDRFRLLVNVAIAGDGAAIHPLKRPIFRNVSLLKHLVVGCILKSISHAASMGRHWKILRRKSDCGQSL